MNLTQGFLKFALATGAQWVMVILILCSILCVAVIFERILYFQKFKGNFPTFIEKLSEKLAKKESFETIAAWCSGQTLLEAHIAAVGLQKARQGARIAEESMYANLVAAKTQLEKNTVILGTLGNNTPFIGLFGTIIGIIGAFHSLSVVSGQRPEAMMSSIAEALVATGLGLFVAIPAVVSFNITNRAVKKKLANAQSTASIILTHIGATTEPPLKETNGNQT